MNEALLDQGGMEPALFDAVIRPYRSLSRRGFGVLMTAVVVVATAVCLGFAALGLWLVLPFFGGEVLFVYWAFRTSYRDRRAYEAVRLTVKALSVEQAKPSGRKQRFSFQPPHWLQVDLHHFPDGSNRLVIRSHGRAMTIGQFLPADEKAGFADALRAALARLGPGPGGVSR